MDHLESARHSPCGEWDARAQRCCALVDTLCNQPPSGRYTAFGPPTNFTACGMFANKQCTPPPVELLPGTETTRGLADTMRRLHLQGYTASTRDLHSDFALYRELAELLGVGVPAVLFFHGSSAPPHEIFEKGFDLGDADPAAFAGRMFYGSVAPKAATYARPYLYLCILEGEEKTIFKPKDRADAHSEQANAADILLISDHTKTEEHLFPNKTFEYPELAIRGPSLHLVTPLACFVMDCPMLSHLCPVMDAQRRERLLLCWTDAQAGAYEAWALWKQEEEAEAATAAKKKQQSTGNRLFF